MTSQPQLSSTPEPTVSKTKDSAHLLAENFSLMNINPASGAATLQSNYNKSMKQIFGSGLSNTPTDMYQLSTTQKAAGGFGHNTPPAVQLSKQSSVNPDAAAP